ncbi:DNA glycosylase AlkZ-like family protein [Amycolatopsis nigrescens]|uniref:DNA glycosylase AlkZ-like family protein n=1 Tax=Amycolatopsis nigrescens TaxID=381445 RepID=UPI0003787724|nr:crosslink repair DNA glycosylase YcaQ family protein [Amycolatopsis nigrescens]
MLNVDRKQVLAYRIAAHGLHRRERDPVKLAVFDLGLQDSLGHTALYGLAARLAGEVTEESLVDNLGLTLTWSHRGAPHYHRSGELASLTAALVPLGEADALARMGWQRKQVAEAGLPATDALFTAARAIRKAVNRTMSKGAASTAVTKLVPPGLSYWCRGCQATHIHEQLMRLAALPGGVRLEAGIAPATLAPITGRGAIRTKPDAAAATEVVAAYLRLNGPSTMTDAGGFVGTTKTVAAEMWPEGLAEVRVDGAPAFLPETRLAELESPPEPDLVRLLPAWDLFLNTKNKALLVPEKARQKEIWRMLGNPGVLIADGDVAGTWRAKAGGRKRLDFTFSPFWTLAPPDRGAAEAEAERVAAARSFPDLRVTWS